MINSIIYKSSFKNHPLIWKLPDPNFKKGTELYQSNCSRKIIKKILMKKNSNSCRDNNNKLFYYHPILISRKFISLCAILLMQFSISTPSLGLSIDSSSSLESRKVLNPSKSDKHGNKILTAENIVIENFKFNDLPLIKRASELLREMDHHVSRPVKDALILLLATVFVVPLMRKFNTSPILGFLAAGLFLGPNGFGLVHRIGASKTLAEFGVVFLLFEMGLE